MKDALIKSIGVFALACLAGCAAHAPAPVIDRAPPAAAKPGARPATPAAAPVEAKPALYTVKKGDTLYSIALEHNQDPRDIVAWNGIENPNRIALGKQLRVTPPEDAVVVKPVATTAPVEIRPLTTAPQASTETLKREPRGGKQPYSDQALADARKADAAPEKPVEKPAEKPAVAEAPPGEPPIDWAWPAGGKLMASFSDAGQGVASKGIDIEGKEGEPVHAAAAGKITLVSNSLRGYGNLVVIKHNPAYLSVYAHNSKILVKEGQPVAKGQKIAEMGSSDAESPRLHFEIRHQGKPVDPVIHLPPR